MDIDFRDGEGGRNPASNQERLSVLFRLGKNLSQVAGDFLRK